MLNYNAIMILKHITISTVMLKHITVFYSFYKTYLHFKNKIIKISICQYFKPFLIIWKVIETPVDYEGTECLLIRSMIQSTSVTSWSVDPPASILRPSRLLGLPINLSCSKAWNNQLLLFIAPFLNSQNWKKNLVEE